MSVRVHIERDPARFTHNIVVTRRGRAAESTEVLMPDATDPTGWTWFPVDRGASTTYRTLSLDTDVLEAIVAAAGDVLPPNAAVDRHLSDSNRVRDRLLTLVEGLVGGDSR